MQIEKRIKYLLILTLNTNLNSINANIPPQDNPSYSCQPYEPDTRTERKSSESSHSPSPASPSQDQIHGRYPASQGLPCGKNKFKASFSTEKFRRYSYEENAAGNYDRFLKSSRNPFHPYKRQISEDVFQEAHQALPPEASPFKNHRSIDGFEDLPGSAGPEEPEAFPTHIPNISAEQPWCSSLQYSTTGQEHGSQVMVSGFLELFSLFSMVKMCFWEVFSYLLVRLH